MDNIPLAAELARGLVEQGFAVAAKALAVQVLVVLAEQVSAKVLAAQAFVVLVAQARQHNGPTRTLHPRQHSTLPCC